MNEKDVVTEAMKSCGWTQKELAARTGYNTQSAISNRLNGKSMRVDTFVKLLATMGYEVLVKSTSSNANKNKWVINYDGDTTPPEHDAPEAPIKKTVDKKSLALDELLKPTGEEKPQGIMMKDGKIRLT